MPPGTIAAVTIDYVNLLGLAAVAVRAPLLVDLVRVPVPDAVAMIFLGVALGTSGLGWIEIDGAVELLSMLSLAYQLFVAGLEVRGDVPSGGRCAPVYWPSRCP